MKGYKERPQVILEAKKAQDLWLAGLGLKKMPPFPAWVQRLGEKKNQCSNSSGKIGEPCSLVFLFYADIPVFTCLDEGYPH